MDPSLLALLQSLPPEQLQAMFEPFQQEQSVLDQQMGIAGQMRQPQGGEHSSPMGALLGGLGNAVGNVGGAMMQAKGLGGQTALGGRQQGDATNRMRMILDILKQGQGAPGMMDAMEPAERLGGGV